jgi:hypothetical protein
MRPARLIGIALLVLGAGALIFDGVTYTKDRDSADLGPLSISIEERETLRIPAWGGIAILIVGATLALMPFRKPG